MIERLDEGRCHVQCDRCALAHDLHAATVEVAADVLRASGWSITRDGLTTCLRCAVSK